MYDRENDINRLFIEDSRDKKRTAIGVHKRASRRGYIRGGIKTQSDFLTPKQRKLLSGEVRVYSMFEEYKDLEKCDLEEILKKSDKDIKNILTIVKANNSCSKICKRFKVSNGKLYSIYNNYGVEYGKKPQASSIRIDKLKGEVISKERFNLMDSVTKGKYVVETTERLNVSMTALCKFWELNKNNVAYYVAMYRKSAENKNAGKIKGTQNKDIAPIVAAETKQMELIEEAIPEISMENELKQKLQQLEEANKRTEEENQKLKENLLKYSMKEISNEFKFKIEVGGEYNKTDLGNRLLSLDNLLIEDKIYKVKIILEEM